MIHRASMRRSTGVGAVMMRKHEQKGPARGRGLGWDADELPLDRLALDFDFDATVGRQTFDQRLALLRIRLVADHARNRLRLTHAEGLDLVSRDALRHKVIADRVGTTLRQLLVVGLGSDAVGVTGHQNELELRHVLQLADDFPVDRGFALGLQDILVEIEQCRRSQSDLLHGRRRRRSRRWRRRWRRGSSRRRRWRSRFRNEIGIALDDRHGRRPVAGPPAERVVDAWLAAIGAASPDVGVGLTMTERYVTAVLRVGLPERRGIQGGGSRTNHHGCDQTKFHQFYPFGVSYRALPASFDLEQQLFARGGNGASCWTIA